MKGGLENVAVVQEEVSALIYEFGCFPMNHWMSWRMKGVDTMSVPPASYSPSLGRKNSTTHARLDMDWYLAGTPWAAYSLQCIMYIEVGWTWPVGGLISDRSQTFIASKIR